MTHEVEEKAQALRFIVQRGTARGAGYVLKDSHGIILGEGFTASLKQIDIHLDDYVVQKAKALGLRLTTQKVASSLYEMSSGAARAATTRTVGYKLERKEVLKDEGRREDTRKQKEDRARAGGQKVEWITVLGFDCSATLSEVIAYLTDYADDIGIGDDDVEVDLNKKPKVAPASVQEMSGSLKGHDNETAIRARGFGNVLGDNKPTKEEADLRRALEVMDLQYYGHERAIEKLSPADREEHDRKRKVIKDRLDEVERQRKAFDKPTPIDPLLAEERRQAAKFRLAERRLQRTNQLSRFDVAADGTRPGLDRDHDWIERNVTPDAEAPDFQAPAPAKNFAIQTKRDAGQRDHGARSELKKAGKITKTKTDFKGGWEWSICEGDHAKTTTKMLTKMLNSKK